MKALAVVFGVLLVAAVGWSQRASLAAGVGIARAGPEEISYVDTSRIVTRRVWSGQDVDILGSPSPDGSFLSHVDWSTGDLAIRDLASGESRRLTDKGSWLESSDFALFSRVSPDGRSVVYNWWNEDYRFDLRLVGVDGAKPRILYGDSNISYIQPHDWSADGQSVLVGTWYLQGDTNHLGIVSVGNGELRTFKKFDWREPGRASFSPDGRYVAYDLRPDEDDTQRDLFLASIDGTFERPLIQHPANDLILGWAPDGRHVLFASDRTGTLSAFVIAVEDGKPNGRPLLVKADFWRVSGLGFTRNGSYFYGLNTGVQDIFIASVDFASGRVTSPPVQAVERFVGSNVAPHWSPDGKYLAYVSQRGAVMNAPGSRTLVIRSLVTGEERTISPELNFFGDLHWSPDGRFLLTVGSDRRNHWGLFVIDAQTGAMTTAVQAAPGANVATPGWSHDGTMIYYHRSDPSEKLSRIFSHDLATGRDVELHRAKPDEWILAVRPSPTGNQVAFGVNQTLHPIGISQAIMVMPAGGGPPREIVRAEGATVRLASWTPDGEHLVYRIIRDPGDLSQPAEVWIAPAAGGAPRRVQLEDERLTGLVIHPDGRRVAYVAGEYSAEVWVMEDFLPELSDYDE